MLVNLITPVNIYLINNNVCITQENYNNLIKINQEICDGMNCKNMIVAGFNSGVNALNQYIPPISEIFQALNLDHKHEMIVVGTDEFVKAVLSDPKNVGICIGGSGVPECVLLNQAKGIRAAVVHNKYIAEMCRKHNNANVMILSTDCIGQKLGGSLVGDYLKSCFDNEERNMLRIGKLKQLQEKYESKIINK